MITALYFGSFNPFHFGHAAIGKWLLTNGGVDRVVYVVSPKNPLKERNDIVPPHKRLEDTRRAVERLSKEPELTGKVLEVEDVEFNMKEPLYTINTLRYFRKTEPDTHHILIMGADNLEIIEKWYKWQELINEFEIWVYPRRGIDTENLCKKYGVKYIDAPLQEISSSYIRTQEKMGIDTQNLRY